MDVNTTRIFKQIVESGSFQKAAGILGLQPAVVTRKISQLEKDLGQKLMTRSKGGVSLTDAGEIMYRMASNISSVEKEALQELRGHTQELQGHIKIYTTTGTLNAWLVEDIIEFLKIHPKVNLNILGTNEPLELVAHKADVIIGPDKKRYESLEKIHIRSYRLKAYASKEYLKQYGYTRHK